MRLSATYSVAHRRITWQPGAMSRPIFVVDAFAAGPFRGQPGGGRAARTRRRARRRLDAAGRGGDEALGDRVRAAPRRRRVRPALVHARGRGRPVRARDARERARAVGDAAARADAAAVFHTRGGELRANRQADGAIELDFPTAPPEPCDAPAGLLDALGLDGGEMLCTTGEFFMLVVPDADDRPRARARLRRDARAARRARRLRDRARRRRRARHRVALLRAGRRHRRRPGDRFDALRARAVLVPAARQERAASASRRRLAAEPSASRLAGDRTLLAGNAVTVLRGELLA